MTLILQSPPAVFPLRLKLQQITCAHGRTDHAALLEALREEFPHSIRVLPDPDPHNTYNCVMHALRLDAQDFGNPAIAAFLAKTSLIDFLIGNGCLTPHAKCIDGFLVVYATNGKAAHIGRLVSNSRIESKWGSGNLCEHELWELPLECGDQVSFFAPLDHDSLMHCFIKLRNGA